MNPEPNNPWIGDFHKALAERNEPKADVGPGQPTADPAPPANQGLADWVKRMGGAKPGGATFVPSSVWGTGWRSALQNEWQRIVAETYNRAFEPPQMVEPSQDNPGDGAAKSCPADVSHGYLNPSWPGCDPMNMPPVSPRDQELAQHALEYVVGPLADIAQACAIAREEGFQAGRYIPPRRPGTADSDVNCFAPNASHQVVSDLVTTARMDEILARAATFLPSSGGLAESFRQYYEQEGLTPATVPCVWDSVSQQYVPVTSHRGVAILNPPVPTYNTFYTAHRAGGASK